MDLNYLLARHQVALLHADATDCREARHSHLGMAAGYAARIRDMQRDLGASVYQDVF